MDKKTFEALQQMIAIIRSEPRMAQTIAKEIAQVEGWMDEVEKEIEEETDCMYDHDHEAQPELCESHN